MGSVVSVGSSFMQQPALIKLPLSLTGVGFSQMGDWALSSSTKLNKLSKFKYIFLLKNPSHLRIWNS